MRVPSSSGPLCGGRCGSSYREAVLVAAVLGALGVQVAAQYQFAELGKRYLPSDRNRTLLGLPLHAQALVSPVPALARLSNTTGDVVIR